MKTVKMKVLLYLKKIGLDKLGKAQIMGADNTWKEYCAVQL